MGRHAVRQVEHHFIDITPAPAFRRVVAFDDGVLGFVEMFGRMLVRRVVATADMAAGPAQPQMHPFGPDLQTFLAAQRAGRHGANSIEMRATISHE